MSKMKLYNVTVNYTLTVGAENKTKAKLLAQSVLSTDSDYDTEETGFCDANYSVSEAKSIDDVPKDWRVDSLFNTYNLDGITAEDVLNGNSIKEIAQKDAEFKLNKTLNTIRSSITKENIINFVIKHPYLK